MLAELAKKHDDWIRYATYISKDAELAHDLVGDMYVKLAGYDKEVNDSYVYYAIKHLWVDHTRREKKRAILEKEVRYFNDVYETVSEETESIIPDLPLPDCLSWVEKQILLMRQTRSGRDIGRQFHLNYQLVHRIEKRAKEKLTQWARQLEVQETL